MRLPRLIIAAALLAPAAAHADDCAPIVAAYTKLSEVPAYRQVIALAGGQSAETVAIGDTLYVKSGSPDWQRMDLPPGGRRQTVMQFLDKDALKGCAAAGADTLNGAAMTKYGYEPPVMGGFTTARQTLWIGDADGLPYRMTSDDGSATVEISYEGVVAPM